MVKRSIQAAIAVLSCSLVGWAQPMSRQCNEGCVTKASIKAGLVEVIFAGQTRAEFHAVWLWHNAPAAFFSSGDRSGARLGTQVSDIRAVEAFASNCRLEVLWADKQRDTFEACFLYENRFEEDTAEQGATLVRPPALRKHHVLAQVNFEQVLHNNSALLELLQGIEEHGIAIVTGVPSSEGMVLKASTRVGPPSHDMLYGETFQVQKQENFKNVAYSNHGLALHQDLVYYDSPPGLQWLHCLENDVDGGDNLFVDVVGAAETFRSKQPKHFQTLTRVPVTFQKKRIASTESAEAAWMSASMPHFNVAGDGHVETAFWAPPWTAALRASPADVEVYYAAAGAFSQMMELDEDFEDSRVRLKPKAGTILVFDNHRILHGRTPIDGTRGSRHLEGTYTNMNDFVSKLNVLKVQLEVRSV